METLNKKTLSFSTRLFAHAVAALAIVSFVAACGNNGGSNAFVGPQVGTLGHINITNCATCTNTMINPIAIDLFNAKNISGTLSLQNMQLIVSGANFIPGASSSYNLYTGPVAVQGVLTLAQTVVDPGMGRCAIPAGNYTIQTAQVGQLSMGVMQIPTLFSTTANIVMELSEGVLYKEAATQTTRMYGTLYIKSVNGQVCTRAFSGLLN